MRYGRPAFLLAFAFLLSTLAAAQSAPQAARDYVYGPRGKLAVTIEPDNYPPGLPSSCGASLAGPCATNGIDVSWGTATDIGSGVASYNLYRNGSWLNNYTTTFFYHDPNIVAGEYYTYCVSAIDNAGHEGEQMCSSPVSYDFCWGGFLRPRDRHHFTARAVDAWLWNPASLLSASTRAKIRQVAIIPPKRQATALAGGGK